MPLQVWWSRSRLAWQWGWGEVGSGGGPHQTTTRLLDGLLACLKHKCRAGASRAWASKGTKLQLSAPCDATKQLKPRTSEVSHPTTWARPGAVSGHAQDAAQAASCRGRLTSKLVFLAPFQAGCHSSRGCVALSSHVFELPQHPIMRCTLHSGRDSKHQGQTGICCVRPRCDAAHYYNAVHCEGRDALCCAKHKCDAHASPIAGALPPWQLGGYLHFTRTAITPNHTQPQSDASITPPPMRSLP